MAEKKENTSWFSRMVVTFYQARLKNKWLFPQPQNRKVCPVSLLVSASGVQTQDCCLHCAGKRVGIGKAMRQTLQREICVCPNVCPSSSLHLSKIVFSNSPKTSIFEEKHVSEKDMLCIFCGTHGESPTKLLCLLLKATSWFITQSPLDTVKKIRHYTL